MFGCLLQPEKFSFFPKIVTLPESGGL